MQALSSEGLPARAPVLTRRVTEDLPSDRLGNRSPVTEYSGSRSPVSGDISEEDSNTDNSQVRARRPAGYRQTTRESTIPSFKFSNDDKSIPIYPLQVSMNDIYGSMKEEDLQIRCLNFMICICIFMYLCIYISISIWIIIVLKYC